MRPPPPSGRPRDPGDAWVVAADGSRYWGTFGAAGLLAVDAGRGVLLQHRAGWSHHGGTWGIPGGALRAGEEPLHGALREAGEEAGVPGSAVRPRATFVVDLEVWAYTTVVADVVEPFEPVISDPESLELVWTDTDEVGERELHPGFASSWLELRALVALRPATVIVDLANVVGSVPDGWWRDRPGATARILERVGSLASAGVPANALGLPGARWYPRWVGVAEGAARSMSDPVGDVELVRAPGAGDDAIVHETERVSRTGFAPVVVTSDRGLTARVESVGAAVRSAGWLLRLFDPAR